MKENVRAMRAARSEKAARLFDALGEIDGAYLDEFIRAEGPAGAENDEKRLYAPQISPAKRRFPWRVAVPVAAAFLLLVTVGGSFLLPAMFVGRAKSAAPSRTEKSDGQYYDVATGDARFEEDGAPTASAEPGKATPEAAENNALRALGQTLENATPARTLASAAAPAGDGNTYLVWRTASGTETFAVSRALTADEVSDLADETTRLTLDPRDGFSDLWLLGPDGSVTALLDPAATRTDGFRSYRMDYPPTARLVEIVREIVG